jgi:hypothetical protein
LDACLIFNVEHVNEKAIQIVLQEVKIGTIFSINKVLKAWFQDRRYHHLFKKGNSHLVDWQDIEENKSDFASEAKFEISKLAPNKQEK